MRIKAIALAAGLAAATVTGTAASADILTLTYTGKVTSAFDSTNTFGSVVLGSSYVASYVFDVTGSSNNVFGGSESGLPSSLVSASVTIGGGTPFVVLAGGSDSIYRDNENADATVRTLNHYSIVSQLRTDLPSLPESITSPFTYLIQSNNPNDVQDISLYTGSSIVRGDIRASIQTLSVTDVANAVPEPSTWAMMILGFVGIGAMTHRRRKSATLAA